MFFENNKRMQFFADEETCIAISNGMAILELNRYPIQMILGFIPYIPKNPAAAIDPAVICLILRDYVITQMN